MKGSRISKFLLFPLLSVLAIAGCKGVEANQPAAGADASSSQQLPFTGNKPLVVPANSTIYIRLQEPISSATAREGQTFNAVLDQPLVVDNQTIAPEGAGVTGTVLAVRESGRLHNAGYLRITLTSITLNGKPTPLQTNSVFMGGDRKHNIAIMSSGKGGVRLLDALAGSKSVTVSKADGTPGSGGKKQVGFAADDRLGFRLTQPLSIS
ncbi:MAG: hypothetical protein LAO20_07695 [Acidobacteriia bacterium]|nr:hypothetical protein [Terriglobia bacterium]